MIVNQFDTSGRFRDARDELVYIHVGKCGGTSLGESIMRSQFLHDRFASISKVHFEKPPILKRSYYLLVLRNPISRAISAFNWRYKLVVEDKIQKDRFVGEYEILSRYGSLNSLAEQLYVNDALDPIVADNFRSIAHLNEDISFYLSELLDHIAPEQFFAVLTTEFLAQEIDNYLKVKDVKRINEHAPNVQQVKMELSQTGRGNLKKFLHKDYDVVRRLLAYTALNSDQKKVMTA